MKIASTLDMSLKDAREFAKNLRAEYQLGRDPYAAAKVKKQIMTWNAYMETIYFPHVKSHLRSWKSLVSLNTRYLEPAIGHLPLDRITLQTAQRLHRDMVEVHGLSPASADHLAKLLKQSTRYAIRIDLIASSSVPKIQLYNVDNRQERLMTDEELQRLMAALEKKPDSTAYHVVKFLLFTGARVNEALHARWVDIDREHRTWVILATNSKSKRRRSVPLNDSALEVLDRLKGNSVWLFTSSRGGGRMVTINKVWQRLRKEAGLTHVRLHDLRHYHASALVNSGRTLYEVQQILGHSDPSVTQRYSHLSTATLQEASAAASDAIRNSAA